MFKNRAAELRHGYWTRPYFDCNGFVKKWVSTYAAPFFGWDSLRSKLEFKGVVTVTMDLQTLDINQCPAKYHTPNAFKDTNKCDLKTSYVSFVLSLSPKRNFEPLILFLCLFCSACPFWAEVSTLAATSASASKATSTRSKTPSLTLTDSWSSPSSLTWWRTRRPVTTCTSADWPEPRPTRPPGRSSFR